MAGLEAADSGTRRVTQLGSARREEESHQGMSHMYVTQSLFTYSSASNHFGNKGLLHGAEGGESVKLRRGSH